MKRFGILQSLVDLGCETEDSGFGVWSTWDLQFIFFAGLYSLSLCLALETSQLLFMHWLEQGTCLLELICKAELRACHLAASFNALLLFSKHFCNSRSTPSGCSIFPLILISLSFCLSSSFSLFPHDSLLLLQLFGEG